MLARILTTPALRRAAIQTATLSYWVCVGFPARQGLELFYPGVVYWVDRLQFQGFGQYLLVGEGINSNHL